MSKFIYVARYYNQETDKMRITLIKADSFFAAEKMALADNKYTDKGYKFHSVDFLRDQENMHKKPVEVYFS